MREGFVVLESARCGPILGGVIRDDRNWPIYELVQPGRRTRYEFSRVLPSGLDQKSLLAEIQPDEILMPPGIVYWRRVPWGN